MAAVDGRAVSYDWPGPLCLIDDKNGLSINEATWEALRKVTVPVVAVSIVGLYRTGKSYLLNRLAKNQKYKGKYDLTPCRILPVQRSLSNTCLSVRSYAHMLSCMYFHVSSDYGLSGLYSARYHQ